MESQIKDELDGLRKQLKTLLTRVATLEKSAAATQKQLDKTFREIYNLLPHDTKKSLRAPAAQTPERIEAAAPQKLE